MCPQKPVDFSMTHDLCFDRYLCAIVYKMAVLFSLSLTFLFRIFGIVCFSMIINYRIFFIKFDLFRSFLTPTCELI